MKRVSLLVDDSARLSPVLGLGPAMPDRDDLEFALQENLKLRRELGTKVAKANDSSIPNEAADFHRLRMILKPLMILRERLRRIGNAP